MASKRIRRRRVYAWFWYDIESSGSWGSDDKDLVVCVTWGVEYAKPNPKDKMPFWRVMGSYSEDEPGGETKIPAALLIRRSVLGWSNIEWRKR